MVSGRSGFSLPEALIALAISSGLVILIGGVMLVQNNHYSHVMLRSQVQENARSVSELVATDLRSLVANGVIVADSNRLVVRTPLTTALICGFDGGDVIAHIPGGVSTLVTADVAGFGYRNPSGLYSYFDQTWAQLQGSSGSPASFCQAYGADTVGVTSEFVPLAPIDDLTGFSPITLVGRMLLLYRRVELRFANSTLAPGELALYRGNVGSTLTELATGISTAAHFEYRRTGGSTWYKNVASASTGTINAVRVVAQSVGKGTSSAERQYEFGWTIDVPLSNAY